ncbi:MAG: hypothetical protein JWO22_139 [Frankiales bacterium]|nr:hypothetical protein [Frankiales bacterium]
MKKLVILAALPVVAACSSGGSGTTAAEPQTSVSRGTQQQQRFPGATGLIAAIDGTTLQVQSSTEQTAVTYSARTAFTDTVKVTAAAVVVGSCVNVRDNTGRPSASTTPDPSATRATTITAVSVSVTAAASGSCTGGFGGNGGAGGSGPQGTPPPGFTPPSGAPTGTRAFGGGGFGGANGKVVSRSATGFVVESNVPGQTASTTTVTTTGTTTYTAQKKATSSALEVGECVTARGQADSSGTVAATSIAIRPKTGTTCDQGFGARRG